jgi:tryptophanyl-tRNA synthetase
MPEHAELFTLLAMHTPLAWLERVPGFREKADQHPTFGLLGYPLLQAADILAHKGEWVPVGQDQAAHLELAREVARRFNHRSGRQLFPMPQARFSDAPRLTGLDGQKMSKSAGNAIAMREAPASVHACIATMPVTPSAVRCGPCTRSSRRLPSRPRWPPAAAARPSVAWTAKAPWPTTS